MKQRYKGTFNYYGQVFNLYTHSTCPEKAFLNFMTQLSKVIGITKKAVMRRFDGSIDNYLIERR